MSQRFWNQQLVNYIIHRIEEHGPVTFKWFMEQCLYHPEHGYYIAHSDRIGFRGDFFTNVSVGKFFGQVMARQFDEIWKSMGKPPQFSIVEQGAHNGQFANDVLSWIKQYSPALYEILTYWIIEELPSLRKLQQDHLAHWGSKKIEWLQQISELDDGTLFGVLFCNELLDSFPVHMITYRLGQWEENYVDFNGKRFMLGCGEPSISDLRIFIQSLPESFYDSYTTEVNIRALRWIEDVARILKRGYILVCDYGYPRSQYLRPERNQGTLSCYRDHRRVNNCFEHIGNCDMTAHVEFTSLVAHALKFGLSLEGFTDQYHFMVGVGKEEFAYLQKHLKDLSPDTRHDLACFKTLMHPNLMGSDFKFLALQKEMDRFPTLAGFQYAADPWAALDFVAPEP